MMNDTEEKKTISMDNKTLATAYIHEATTHQQF